MSTSNRGRIGAYRPKSSYLPERRSDPIYSMLHVFRDENVDQISYTEFEQFVSKLNSRDNNGSPSSLENDVLANKRRENIECPEITKRVKIPKILLQTWKDNNIPDHWKDSPKSIKEHMKGWTYILMTDEDNLQFCKKHFPDFYPYFVKFPHAIQRADAIRYMWLYVYGGVYMDLDIVIEKPLDPLFYADSELYLCSSGNVGSCLTNSFMACKPRCEIWLKMIEHMKQEPSWWMLGKHMEVMNTTGPVALNYVVKQNHYPYLALPAKDVMPCSVCNITHCKVGGAYLKPLIGSSWIGRDTRFFNFFMCNWRAVIIAAVIIFVLILIYLLLYYTGIAQPYRYMVTTNLP